jgi:ATP:corrinoid adenosyltransferase
VEDRGRHGSILMMAGPSDAALGLAWRATGQEPRIETVQFAKGLSRYAEPKGWIGCQRWLSTPLATARESAQRGKVTKEVQADNVHLDEVN